MSREEVTAVLKQLTGTMKLIGVLLYGAGLRLRECLELRVKDVDFDRGEILVRQGKGQKDRVTCCRRRRKRHCRRIWFSSVNSTRTISRTGMPFHGRRICASGRTYPPTSRVWREVTASTFHVTTDVLGLLTLLESTAVEFWGRSSALPCDSGYGRPRCRQIVRPTIRG